MILKLEYDTKTKVLSAMFGDSEISPESINIYKKYMDHEMEEVTGPKYSLSINSSEEIEDDGAVEYKNIYASLGKILRGA